MAGAGYGRSVMVMVISAGEAFTHHTFESAGRKLIAEPVEVLVPHLVYNNAYYQFGFFGG
ncbi:hypothetical protein D9M68_907700 [compost metagenome]